MNKLLKRNRLIYAIFIHLATLSFAENEEIKHNRTTLKTRDYNKKSKNFTDILTRLQQRITTTDIFDNGMYLKEPNPFYFKVHPFIRPDICNNIYVSALLKYKIEKHSPFRLFENEFDKVYFAHKEDYNNY